MCNKNPQPGFLKFNFSEQLHGPLPSLDKEGLPPFIKPQQFNGVV